MSIDIEKLIDELATRAQNGRDISHAQRNPHIAPLANLIARLASFPKADLPKADLLKLKNQIMDRISIPAEETIGAKASVWASIPYLIRSTAGIVGSLLIVVSLGVGTAVAALQSVPGEAIYPLKKVVENIELKLTMDKTAKANLQIQFANNRLDEIEEVLEKNQAGEISNSETQKIVKDTLEELQKTATAALNTTSETSDSKPKVSALSKIVDLSNKQVAVLKPLLSAAAIQNEGEVKIVLQKALETSLDSKQQAIKNIENAGLKIEDAPIIDNAPESNLASANGKITAITVDSISIGTSKFTLTKETQYVGLKAEDLKLDLAVAISGEVNDDKKTYATIITAANPVDETSTDTETDTNSENQTETPSTPETEE